MVTRLCHVAELDLAAMHFRLMFPAKWSSLTPTCREALGKLLKQPGRIPSALPAEMVPPNKSPDATLLMIERNLFVLYRISIGGVSLCLIASHMLASR